MGFSLIQYGDDNVVNLCWRENGQKPGERGRNGSPCPLGLAHLSAGGRGNSAEDSTEVAKRGWQQVS